MKLQILIFFLILSILSCFESAAKAAEKTLVREIEEQVNVFVGNIIRPVTYAGSGWLTGAFSNSQPHDSLLLPLKTQRIRSREEYIVSVYDKCKKLGISMEVVTNRHRDVWAKMALDGTDDMAPYVERHEALVNRMLERGMSGLSYSIFQESNDERHLGWNEQNEPYYLEAYRLAYNAIKNTDSTALVVGPNAQWAPYSWWWKDHEGDYTWFIRNFIDYCIENQCMPDVIAWRSWDCEGFDIAAAAEEIRNHLKERGIPPIPLEQDDLGCKARQFSPGSYVSYLANIERAEITYTCKCCWDGDCFINTLQGLLTKEDRQPRSLWWMYKSYGELTGQIVEVIPSLSVDGVVAIDNESDIIRAVIGRYKDNSGPVLIRFQGLESRFKTANVLAERIKNTEALAVVPDLHIAYDSGNIHIAGEDSVQGYKNNQEQITHMHFKDFTENGKLCIPGQGIIDFPNLIKAMKAANYTGYINLETPMKEPGGYEYRAKAIEILGSLIA